MDLRNNILYDFYHFLKYGLWLNTKQKLYLSYSNRRIVSIRKKKEIKVLFVLAELGAWKTESLYKKMLNHPRFVPILGITTSQEAPGSKQVLVNYIINKGYDYIDLDKVRNSIKKIKPDIKFYYKPYEKSYPKGIYFDKHMSSIVCHINYALNGGGDYQWYRHDIRKYSWACFIENKLVDKTIKSIPGIFSKTNYITGVPIQDTLTEDRSLFMDPWKKMGKQVKRIIYAPHHSFPGTNGDFLEYATFLLFGEFMLEMAHKYQDSVQWAFKPHPNLYRKLIKVWGKDKTDNYYNSWKTLENSQIELGDYIALFKYSDAMIHDCSSFTIEYLYTGNPVMFLQVDKSQTDKHLGIFGREAYLSHYIGSCEKEIEQFISDVISGNDSMKEKRISFYEEYLLPPNNQSACDNIIQAILGEGAYKS